MSKCVLREFLADGSINNMTCDLVKENHLKMKEKFRKTNRTDELMRSGKIDKAYVEYCKSLDDFIAKCECEKI